MRPENSIRLISVFVCTLLFTFLLVSCQPSNSGTNTATGGAGTKHKLAFVTNNASDFWTIARKGTEKAAKDIPNIEVEFRIPSDGTAAEQQRVIDDLLAKGIHGIAISPVDPANQTQMLNRAADKTLVVTQDSDAPNSNRICYIGTDNVEAGRQAGQLVKEALPNGNVIRV
jgi:ribose transport system substrate-binding protein